MNESESGPADLCCRPADLRWVDKLHEDTAGLISGTERHRPDGTKERIAHYVVDAKERPAVALSADAGGARFWFGTGRHPSDPHVPVWHMNLGGEGVTYLRAKQSEIDWVRGNLIRLAIGSLDPTSLLFREICSLAGRVFQGQSLPPSENPSPDCPYCPRSKAPAQTEPHDRAAPPATTPQKPSGRQKMG